MVDVPSKVRENECIILDSLINAAAGAQANLKKFNQCIRMQKQLEDLKETQDFLVTKDDVDLLKTGFKASASKRPIGWTTCGDLFESLENPSEVDAVVESETSTETIPVE